MSDTSSKLALKRELPRHLSELSLLLGRPVAPEELLSLEKTKEVQSRASVISRKPTMKYAMSFEEKKSSRFAAYVQRLGKANRLGIYVWTPASNLCGVLRPVSLESINMTFPFDVNTEGIVTFLSGDLRDELLLDFSIGSDGKPQLEIEASGENWGGITY